MNPRQCSFSANSRKHQRVLFQPQPKGALGSCADSPMSSPRLLKGPPGRQALLRPAWASRLGENEELQSNPFRWEAQFWLQGPETPRVARDSAGGIRVTRSAPT